MGKAETGASHGRGQQTGWRRALKRIGVDLRPGEGEAAAPDLDLDHHDVECTACVIMPAGSG